MKRKMEKKLSLGKIRIASLSKDSQDSIRGGRINLSRTTCGHNPLPATTRCTTGYVICSC